MGAGRFVCVALPLILTIASIVVLLIATLSGVAQKDLFIFSVDLSGFKLGSSTLGDLAGDLGLGRRAGDLTAGDLGLGSKYEVELWGYCTKDTDGKTDCTHPEFDWASKRLNTSYLDDLGSVAGVDVSLPSDIKDALKAFRTGIKWIEVAYIVALGALGVELFFGLFAVCSRGISCITWLTASIAATLVCVCAAATTALAAIVTGAIDGSAKKYGVKCSIGTHYLAVVWIAAALAIGAAATWIFTICCCKPDRHSRKNGYKHRSTDAEKLLPSSYAPLDRGHEHETMGHTGFYDHADVQPGYHAEPQYAQFDSNNNSYEQYGSPNYPSGAGRSDAAYEPYSHRA